MRLLLPAAFGAVLVVVALVLEVDRSLAQEEEEGAEATTEGTPAEYDEPEEKKGENFARHAYLSIYFLRVPRGEGVNWIGVNYLYCVAECWCGRGGCLLVMYCTYVCR